MGRGGRTDMKQRNNQHLRKKVMDSEDSDEDYVAEVDEVDDQSEEMESWVADASEEESCFEAEEGEEEEEEEDEDGRENGWRTIVKPKPQPKPKTKTKPKSKQNIRKGSARSKKNRTSRPMKRRKVTYNVDDSNEEDDDDDDDEEFTPDEIEHFEEEEEEEEEDVDDEEEEEEEEFPPVKTKSKKRGRASLKGKKSVKSKRRKRTTKVVKKPSRKRSKRTGSSRRTANSGDDEDFFEEGRNLRGRTNRKSAHRKKRVKVGSDSDFCSDSSDYDFTISEEEREQIREANELCRTLPTNLRSSRRIQEEEEDFCEPKRPPARKGKEKAEEKKNDTGKPVCGICLTEEAKNTIRGMLNCCSHYFCFACIMEWSKVETRCPLCKQRFVTISKPARCSKGFDLRDAVISVPERDQVYQPSEEELRDFLNPYENVICTECHQGGDDALMLLCDLCDSPAHTYCVGLGQEVPEGNWYCDGCRPAALASSQTQTEDLSLDQRPGARASDEQSTYENMAEIDLNVTIPETPVSQGNGFLSSPRFLGGSFQAPSPASGMGVSTVSGRRRIHRQIQYILSNRRSQNGGDISSLGNLISLGFNPHQRSRTTEVGTSHHAHQAYILSNRRSQNGGDISSLGNQRSRTTEVGTSHHAHQADRSLEPLPNIGQNSDFFPGRQGHMIGQVDQGLRAANNSAHSHLLWGLSSSQPQSSASEQQLRSCSDRSSIEPSIPSHSRDDRSNLLKREVHSLVRSQLRSLALSNNDYIEISRRSVCTIMAAYGLEPRASDALEARLPMCQHFADGNANVLGLSPLKDCCVSCFQGFVKDVVTRVKDMIVPSHWLGFR